MTIVISELTDKSEQSKVCMTWTVVEVFAQALTIVACAMCVHSC